MKKLPIILILIIHYFLPLFTIGQDIHLSQFFFSPLTLNPANTGNHNGAYRTALNYRRQWSVISPFSTLAVSYDQQAFIKKENFSTGGIIVYDRTNQSAFYQNKIYFSAAYHKKIHKNRFHGGIQIGLVHKGFNINKLTFPDQWDRHTGHFNAQLNHNEAGMLENRFYPDINAGIGWSRKFYNKEFYGGIGFFHVLPPNESFNKSKSKLPPRVNINAGGDINLPGRTWYFTPNILFMRHNKAAELLSGLHATYVVSDVYLERSVFAGIYSRNEFKNFDAVVIVAGMNYNEWVASVSYDINTSGLNIATNARGGIEISVIYTAVSNRMHKYAIPCNRF